MAKIIGGLAVSHTPTIGFAVDHHKQQEEGWAPIFDGFAPMQRWLEEKNPTCCFTCLTITSPLSSSITTRPFAGY